MLLVEAMASEIRQEPISEYKKENEIDKLKEEVNCLLKKIKTLNGARVKKSVFGSTDHTRVEIYSNGNLFSGERYLDKQMGYYRTRMNKATIDDIPEKHKITVLEIQKKLMENVLDKFSNGDLYKK